jgi:hypothetical protein
MRHDLEPPFQQVIYRAESTEHAITEAAVTMQDLMPHRASGEPLLLGSVGQHGVEGESA